MTFETPIKARVLLRQANKEEIESEDWFPAGPLKIGITAGASTPDVKVDESIERLLSFRGLNRNHLTGA
jgi:4-hydroxy-3-methylbut-2-enyl diphosphate reductase IspH